MRPPFRAKQAGSPANADNGESASSRPEYPGETPTGCCGKRATTDNYGQSKNAGQNRPEQPAGAPACELESLASAEKGGKRAGDL